MIQKITQALATRRRRKQFEYIRREFARHGVPLEHVDDSAVEAALTRGSGSIDDISLNSKIIYLASRRLPRQKRAQGAKSAARPQQSGISGGNYGS